jgi:hypothetical protein
MKNVHSHFNIFFLSAAQASVSKNLLNQQSWQKELIRIKIRQATLEKRFFEKRENLISCL